MLTARYVMLGKKEVVTSLKGVSLQGWVVQKSGNAKLLINFLLEQRIECTNHRPPYDINCTA